MNKRKYRIPSPPEHEGLLRLKTPELIFGSGHDELTRIRVALLTQKLSN